MSNEQSAPAARCPLPALLLAGIVLTAVLSAALHGMFVADAPGANDLYPRWRGAQLFWQEGIDPYSEEASLAIQTGIYGRPALPDEDQVLFVYPFYAAFFMWPLAGLSYDWAQAIWMAVVMLSLATAVILLLRLFDWRQSVWLLGVTLLWSVIFYHSARTVLLGQFAGPVFLFMAASLLSLKRGRDGWAGLFLALATLKPQMIFLLIPALLGWTAGRRPDGRRRWRFWWGFGGMMAGLTAVSFLLLPGWLAGFARQVGYYPDYTVTGPPVWVITGYYWPQLGKPVEYALSLLLLAWMGWQWRHLRHLTLDSPRFWLIIGLTLVVTNSVILRTATTNYVVMYLPLLLGLKWMGARYGRIWPALFFLASIVSLWALFFATAQGDFEHPVMYLPLPLGLLAWFAVYEWRNRRSLAGETDQI